MSKKIMYSLLSSSAVLLLLSAFYLWRYFSQSVAQYDLLSRDIGSELLGWAMICLIAAYGVLATQYYRQRERASRRMLIILAPFVLYSLITLLMLAL